MEHFKEVLNQPEPTIELDIDNSDDNEELEVNISAITADEVTRAINSFTNNKAPGIDRTQQRCSNMARTLSQDNWSCRSTAFAGARGA